MAYLIQPRKLIDAQVSTKLEGRRRVAIPRGVFPAEILIPQEIEPSLSVEGSDPLQVERIERPLELQVPRLDERPVTLVL